jgi:hypothetical protein
MVACRNDRGDVDIESFRSTVQICRERASRGQIYLGAHFTSTTPSIPIQAEVLEALAGGGVTRTNLVLLLACVRERWQAILNAPTTIKLPSNACAFAGRCLWARCGAGWGGQRIVSEPLARRPGLLKACSTASEHAQGGVLFPVVGVVSRLRLQ